MAYRAGVDVQADNHDERVQDYDMQMALADAACLTVALLDVGLDLYGRDRAETVAAPNATYQELLALIDGLLEAVKTDDAEVARLQSLLAAFGPFREAVNGSALLGLEDVAPSLVQFVQDNLDSYQGSLADFVNQQLLARADRTSALLAVQAPDTRALIGRTLAELQQLLAALAARMQAMLDSNMEALESMAELMAQFLGDMYAQDTEVATAQQQTSATRAKLKMLADARARLARRWFFLQLQPLSGSALAVVWDQASNNGFASDVEVAALLLDLVIPPVVPAGILLKLVTDAGGSVSGALVVQKVTELYGADAVPALGRVFQEVNVQTIVEFLLRWNSSGFPDVAADIWTVYFRQPDGPWSSLIADLQPMLARVGTEGLWHTVVKELLRQLLVQVSVGKGPAALARLVANHSGDCDAVLASIGRSNTLAGIFGQSCGGALLQFGREVELCGDLLTGTWNVGAQVTGIGPVFEAVCTGLGAALGSTFCPHSQGKLELQVILDDFDGVWAAMQSFVRVFWTIQFKLEGPAAENAGLVTLPAVELRYLRAVKVGFEQLVSLALQFNGALTDWQQRAAERHCTSTVSRAMRWQLERTGRCILVGDCGLQRVVWRLDLARRAVQVERQQRVLQVLQHTARARRLQNGAAGATLPPFNRLPAQPTVGDLESLYLTVRRDDVVSLWHASQTGTNPQTKTVAYSLRKDNCADWESLASQGRLTAVIEAPADTKYGDVRVVGVHVVFLPGRQSSTVSVTVRKGPHSIFYPVNAAEPQVVLHAEASQAAVWTTKHSSPSCTPVSQTCTAPGCQSGALQRISPYGSWTFETAAPLSTLARVTEVRVFFQLRYSARSVAGANNNRMFANDLCYTSTCFVSSSLSQAVPSFECQETVPAGTGGTDASSTDEGPGDVTTAAVVSVVLLVGAAPIVLLIYRMIRERNSEEDTRYSSAAGPSLMPNPLYRRAPGPEMAAYDVPDDTGYLTTLPDGPRYDNALPGAVAAYDNPNQYDGVATRAANQNDDMAAAVYDNPADIEVAGYENPGFYQDADTNI